MLLMLPEHYAGDIMDPDRKKYSLEYYMKIADQLVEHGVHSLAIKVTRP